MAPKAAHEAAKARAAKEKKLLAVLALPLVIALYFAYHTVTKLHGSGSSAPPPAASTQPASTTNATTTPGSTTPATVTPAASGIALAEGSGTLNSLGRLASKDPFHDGGPKLNSSGAGSSSGAAKKSAGHKAKKAGGGKKPPAVPPTSAVISVNRQLTSVALGGVFPVTASASTDGIFRLVAVTKSSAKVTVVGGSYASGARTLTLTMGVAVTLVNTADGTKYTLELFPPGTPVASSSSSSTTTGSTTTTTTTTTTGP